MEKLELGGNGLFYDFFHQVFLGRNCATFWALVICLQSQNGVVLIGNGSMVALFSNMSNKDRDRFACELIQSGCLRVELIITNRVLE